MAFLRILPLFTSFIGTLITAASPPAFAQTGSGTITPPTPPHHPWEGYWEFGLETTAQSEHAHLTGLGKWIFGQTGPSTLIAWSPQWPTEADLLEAQGILIHPDRGITPLKLSQSADDAIAVDYLEDGQLRYGLATSTQKMQDDQPLALVDGGAIGRFSHPDIGRICLLTLGPIVLADMGRHGLVIARSATAASVKQPGGVAKGWRLSRHGNQHSRADAELILSDALPQLTVKVRFRDGPSIRSEATALDEPCAHDDLTHWARIAHFDSYLEQAPSAAQNAAPDANTDGSTSGGLSAATDDISRVPTHLPLPLFPDGDVGDERDDGLSEPATEALSNGDWLSDGEQIELLASGVPRIPSRRPIRGSYLRNSFPDAAEVTQLQSLWRWRNLILGLNTATGSTNFVFAQDVGNIDVLEGDIMFQGLESNGGSGDGAHLVGLAMVFTPCGRFSVPAKGTISRGNTRVVFRGARPILDDQCQVVGEGPYTMVLDRISGTSATIFRPRPTTGSGTRNN